MTDARSATIVPLARPSISDADVAAAERALRSGRLVLGPENLAFEAALAGRTGRAHAVCTTSGTTALELALWALGVGAGDDVLVPAACYPAAAHAALRLGASVVAADVDAATWCLDVNAARAALTPATSAIVSVDQLGAVAEAAPLGELAAEAGAALIDDAACGLGGRDPAGVPGGGYGACATLSFHPRKVITSGEGGAIVCDDDAVAARLRAIRNQGQAGRGRFTGAGTNARLGESAAALGRSQLERLDDFLAERRLLAGGYRERLAHLRDAGRLSWQVLADGSEHSYQTFAVLLAEGSDRGRVAGRLADAGIETAPAVYSLSRVGSVAALPGIAGRAFPRAEALHERGLALPVYAGMRSAELDRVAEALEEALA